ncbi:oligopeptide/dipeptide ABC transporter ATP-binding protein [Alsobacter sp. KACC 23698]|uniref:Oligopeptide/dipeptide ABC transporter ATP-binding protein n=1 Tax=Alsobacter sp. KACC 23698 TaxID=3149229 RepID=A0AAU7JKK2_9HYPH
MDPLLQVHDLQQRFDASGGFFDRLRWRNGRLSAPRRIVHAVNGVSLSIGRGEVLGIVGESGCGKSTLAKTVIKLHQPTGGRIVLDGENITDHDFARMRPIRSKMQMIFQDPYASLNPRQRVSDIVMEPFLEKAPGKVRDAKDRALALLAKVGLGPEHADRYPHQFSGGQRQRIGIARALSVEPELIIADEPVSALDVSIQAQILNLMMDLKDEMNFAYLFITHDLSVVRHISDRIGVMYLGFMVETGSTDAIFKDAKHPYTRALLAAAPVLGEPIAAAAEEIKGEVPSAFNLPSGCCFRTRCPLAFDRCAVERPALRPQGDGHAVACHLHDATATSAAMEAHA